jgi:hypothetical protein
MTDQKNSSEPLSFPHFLSTADAQHTVAVQAVVELHRRGELLHVTPQVLVEFRSVATRPTNLNGLGRSTADAQRQPPEDWSSRKLLASKCALPPIPSWMTMAFGQTLAGAFSVLGWRSADPRLR